MCKEENIKLLIKPKYQLEKEVLSITHSRACPDLNVIDPYLTHEVRFVVLVQARGCVVAGGAGHRHWAAAH